MIPKVLILPSLALAAALALGSAAGCAAPEKRSPVHSADVTPETYVAVDRTLRDGGYTVTSRNLLMSYSEGTSTVVVKGAFVAPASEGGGEFGTLTMGRQPDGSWKVIGKQ